MLCGHKRRWPIDDKIVWPKVTFSPERMRQLCLRQLCVVGRRTYRQMYAAPVRTTLKSIKEKYKSVTRMNFQICNFNSCSICSAFSAKHTQIHFQRAIPIFKKVSRLITYASLIFFLEILNIEIDGHAWLMFNRVWRNQRIVCFCIRSPRSRLKIAWEPLLYNSVTCGLSICVSAMLSPGHVCLTTR